MAPQKRKAAQAGNEASPVKKRGRPSKVQPSTGNTTLGKSTTTVNDKKRSAVATAASSRPTRVPGHPASTDSATDENNVKGKAASKNAKVPKVKKSSKKEPAVTEPASKIKKAKANSSERRQSDISIQIPSESKNSTQYEEDDEPEDVNGPSYWLMKAEPESRMEKGKDVKFSIDNLKNASQPEAWDGVRNPTARNNMRAMLKGDLAFFYHSNCKVPGIVGVMEIVQEHSVDESAFDPDHPYFDPKSTRESPKWFVVNVEFRQKFPNIVKLKDLQKYAQEGGILERMQTLKQSRLSVSKVSKKEWDFIMGLVDVDSTVSAEGS